jgi:hypothetical protein
VTALVDGSDERFALELDQLRVVKTFESAFAWIKCQVICPGLLEGLHYLNVLTQVHCEWVPHGQHDAE